MKKLLMICLMLLGCNQQQLKTQTYWEKIANQQEDVFEMLDDLQFLAEDDCIAILRPKLLSRVKKTKAEFKTYFENHNQIPKQNITLGNWEKFLSTKNIVEKALIATFNDSVGVC